MRGKEICQNFGAFGFRITPAYAGKSFDQVLNVRMPEDHPRLCGEKRIAIKLQLKTLGSPPPMRGKAKSAAYCFGVRGITPAYAGKSLDLKWKAKKQQDHPRLCGEKFHRLQASPL